MRICVTGGTGYIGSHAIIELILKGYSVGIIDNLSRSNIEVLNQIKKITGIKPIFYNIDIRNTNKIISCFKKEKFDLVMHFAGYKSVSESIKYPDLYFSNNYEGTISLVKAMEKCNIKNLIFSSSCTVYGKIRHNPLIETDIAKKALCPYGQTKIEIEHYLIKESQNNLIRTIILRYFNPIGGHKSGLIGENINSSTTNIMPLIVKNALSKKGKLKIFGNNYNTKDGTCVRDYIHVVDLARAHVKSIKYFKNKFRYEIFNLGTGKGVTVLELIKTFEKVNKTKVNYEFCPRRSGDAESAFASPSKANKLLKWKARLSLEQMCRDAIKYPIHQTKNF